MALKSLISSPLEAGTSILDAHRLPPHLAPALEYTSKRLARKGLHITLVVARREYQLPGCISGEETATSSRAKNPTASLPTPPVSPASPDAVPCVPVFRSLARSGTDPHVVGAEKSHIRPPQRSKTTSLTKKASLASLFDGSLSSPRLRWPLTPRTPTAVPQTPATPASSVTTASSMATSSAEGIPDAPPSSIRLIHTAPLAPRADRLVASTLARATRKFNLSASLNARDAAAYNIYPEVLHHSILQNEVLFCSEGLTLLSLDHLYTFKSALVHYATCRSELGSHYRLEDAVDELRRYILSSTGRRRKLLKNLLPEMYEWLGAVSETAFKDVMRMYSRAYGDLEEDTGVEAGLCKVSARTSEEESTRPVAPTPPPKSPRRVVRVIGSPTSAIPVSAGSQSRSPQNWVVEDFSPMADEGMVKVPETPHVKEEPLAHVEEQSSPDEAGQVGNDKTPTAPKVAPITVSEAKGQQKQQEEAATPMNQPAVLSQDPLKPVGRAPTPRASPKASLPTLKIQTSFTKPKPPPKRKTTPMPTHLPKRVSPREKSPDTEATSPPQQGSVDDIAIVLHADDEGDDTDFEDADLTARPPPSAVDGRPGGAFFFGGSSIDQMVSGDRQQDHGPATAFWHHRRSSSVAGMSPQQCEGPMTPNGYEDISPITRGEWGFLMVSDPFKTKTAAVETF